MCPAMFLSSLPTCCATALLTHTLHKSFTQLERKENVMTKSNKTLQLGCLLSLLMASCFAFCAATGVGGVNSIAFGDVPTKGLGAGCTICKANSTKCPSNCGWSSYNETNDNCNCSQCGTETGCVSSDN